jgi:PIN domain nuclease of toxin-antitoxin system
VSTKTVLDSSALLAYVFEEDGADAVEGFLGSAIMSAVNWTEVLAKIERKIGSAGKEAMLKRAPSVFLEIVSYDSESAEKAASLGLITEEAGLSMADNACLGLGIARKLPVVTADRVWSSLNLGIEIRSIR